MANLHNKVRAYLGRNFSLKEIKLQNDLDERGDYISYWSDEVEKSQPTVEQLNALESEADTIQNNSGVISTRKKLYGTLAEQLEYIVENGVDAFIAKQNQIKSDNPKS